MMANFEAWLNKPFSADQSAERWFLFIGFIIIVIVAWAHIMGFITKTIEG
jgi:hypothetical protein